LYFLSRTIKNVDVDEVNVSTQQRKGFFFLFHGMPQQGVFHFTCVALEVRCWFCLGAGQKPNIPVKNPWDELCLMAFKSLESKKRCNVFPASSFIPALVAGIRGD